ncbi:homeobox protein VENTX [Eublepharis macularius]|uniref:Homeobox protein VENTX n=1 Tax=Eublepharis macularius TaxID=481883 RepID=A0AA97JGI7_EUBMA|nr:homeobox protein VENTX [Eublepharis macularius]
MTKAPFSVEWLSQSSQATKAAPSRAGVQQAASSVFPSDFQTQQGDPASNSQPVMRATMQSGNQVTSRAQEAPSEPLLALQKNGECPSSAADPRREWNAAECSSDGEGSVVEGQSPEDAGGRNTSSRRLRTAFSLEQISTLESSFKRHKYLGAAERRKLASKMQLSEVQIKTWFQNRRMKLKRQLQEMRPDPFHAAPYYSSLHFGPHSGSLSYVYSPHQQTFTRREAFPSGIPFSPMPTSTLDPTSTSGGQSGAIWPMSVPYFVGYPDPRTFFLTL